MRKTQLPEQLARNILKALKIEEPVISIQAVIKYLSESRNITISILEYDLPDNISGAHAKKGDKHIITFNRNHHPHRQRFTVAHELGHLLLEHVNLQNNEEDFSTKKPEETAANKFAAELLVPLDFLKKDFEKGVRDVKALANKYEVSEETMWWRIMDTRLFRRIRR